jgi:hypothetical protein
MSVALALLHRSILVVRASCVCRHTLSPYYLLYLSEILEPLDLQAPDDK